MKVMIAKGCPNIEVGMEKYPFIKEDKTLSDSEEYEEEEDTDPKEREQKKAKKSVIGAVIGFHESLKSQKRMGVIKKNEPNPDSCITAFPWILECILCQHAQPVSNLGFCAAQCQGCRVMLSNPEHIGSECATHNTCFYPKKFQENHKKCK